MRTKPVPGFRWAKTRDGDTLQAIALRELDDAAKWPELVGLNNLLPPFIVDSLAELEGDTEPGRVLLAGQAIKIPAPGARASGVQDTSDLFGTDLDLTGGRLSVTETGDLRLISGSDNLTQALDHKLVTHRGELMHHREYGQRFHELHGGPQNALTNLLATGYAEQAIRQDPRVARTKGLKGEMRGDVTNISGWAVAIDGKLLPVGGE